jgi:hypothetical protein
MRGLDNRLIEKLPFVFKIRPTIPQAVLSLMVETRTGGARVQPHKTEAKAGLRNDLWVLGLQTTLV